MNIQVRLIAVALTSFFLLMVVSCSSNPYPKGKKIYDTYCVNCHMEDGTGLASLIPPLANADYLKNNQDQIPCIILKGINDTIVVNGRTFAQKMEGVKLTSIQLTNLINYINNAWGNEIPPRSLSEIERYLINCNQ